MPQLSQCLRFYLTDTLAGDIKVLSHFLQSSFMTSVVETKTQPYHPLLARAQSLQHVAGDLSQVRGNHSSSRTLTRLVFNQIAELGIPILANWSFERNWILHKFPGLANLLHGGIHLLRDLFRRRLSPQLTHELTRSVLEFIYYFDHMNRNTNSPRLIGNCSSNCLTNPPCGVG